MIIEESGAIDMRRLFRVSTSAARYLWLFLACAILASGAPPVLLFSDLDWGPKTGWEGATAKGAAITVWGLNFGAVRGASYVTVNSASLVSDSDYAEWGVIGPARGLQRITFWLNSACADGTGTITVNVGGVASNPLPFMVAPGAIYFIAPTGNNTNNGRTLATAWRDILKFNPANNPSGNRQYIVYVRGGVYTTMDADNAFVALRGPYGDATRRKALVAYPGETPVLDCSSATRGVIWNAAYSPYGRNSYFTYSKLKVVNGWHAIATWGDFIRVVGNSFEDMRKDVWAGVVMVGNSQQVQVLGNYWRNCGFDSYKHNIYIKTHGDHVTGDKSVDQVSVGWNEIADPYAGADNRGGAIFISRSSDSGSKYTRNIFIHDNYFHGGNMEHIYTGDNTPLNGDIFIYNNIFRENTDGAGGIFLAWGTSNAYLYNNTFYKLKGVSPGQMIAITGAAHCYFKNNIFYTLSGQNFILLETYQGATFNSDHDLYYDPDGSTSPPSGAGMTVTNALTGDPQFVNAAGGVFSLQASSPAVNTGTSAVSGTLTTDFYGMVRPQGSGYDEGAIEYVAGSDGRLHVR